MFRVMMSMIAALVVAGTADAAKPKKKSVARPVAPVAGANLGNLFSKLDTNKDGVLSADEFNKLNLNGAVNGPAVSKVAKVKKGKKAKKATAGKGKKKAKKAAKKPKVAKN